MKREGKRKTRGKLLQNDKSPTESKDTSDGTSSDAEHEPMEAIQAKIIAEIKVVCLDVKT